MADFNYDTIILDEYGRIALYKVEGTTDTECTAASKVVKDYTDTVVTPMSSVSDTIDAQLETKCGTVQTSGSIDIAVWKNVTADEVDCTGTDITLPDPTGMDENIFHRDYELWVNESKYFFDQDGTGRTMWRIVGQTVKFQKNLRGSNVILKHTSI